ncbi:MAG: hypothetical protein HYU64_00220 [Armatimonadetes bacterium]|nr:hypothetical protein [Armatimonadota bacterium]
MGKTTLLAIFLLALCTASGILIWWVKTRVVRYRKELEAVRSRLLLDPEKDAGILSKGSMNGEKGKAADGAASPEK